MSFIMKKNVCFFLKFMFREIFNESLSNFIDYFIYENCERLFRYSKLNLMALPSIDSKTVHYCPFSVPHANKSTIYFYVDFHINICLILPYDFF